MASLVPVQELRGIGLPALKGNGGYFASKTKYDVAFSDLLHAILTPLGSRPMNRGFGSSVHSSLFEPATVASHQALLLAIRTAVARGAPHLYVSDVKAQSDGKSIALGVKFGLVEERATQDRVVVLTKSDVARYLAGRSLQ